MYRLTNYISVLCALSACSLLLFSACKSSSSSDDDLFEDGMLIDIIEILGEENLNTLENDLDVPINRGDNPPNIEAVLTSIMMNYGEPSVMNQGVGAVFVMAPLIMKESVVPNDPVNPGGFLDLYFRLSEQNMENYTIKMENKHPGEAQGTSVSSFIMGEDDRFTLAGEVVYNMEFEGETRQVVSVQVVSGQLTEAGVVDTHFAVMMVDNAEIPDRIPNGTGRSFIDGQGLSEPAEFPEDEDENEEEGSRPASIASDILSWAPDN
jgi:hypothetical protein